MRAGLFILLFCPVASLAAEIPAEWRCREKELARYWEGVPSVDQKRGPSWGGNLAAKAPTPFLWLVVHQHRDRDLAERRASIVQRWEDFTPAEKCAYLGRYEKEAEAKRREFDALAAWRQDGALAKLLARLGEKKADPVLLQNEEPLSTWRARFEAMLIWLEAEGLDAEVPGAERASGVLLLLGRLKTAFQEFRVETKEFEVKVRRRAAEAGADPEFIRRLGSAGALWGEPDSREAAILELGRDLSRDPNNERILAAEFESRVARVLEGRRQGKRREDLTVKALNAREEIKKAKAAREKAAAAVEALEKELKAEKIVFPAAAEASLLLSLQEYRRGKTELYELAQTNPDKQSLTAAYLEMLQKVCTAHYQSIRYKAAVIKTLCGG